MNRLKRFFVDSIDNKQSIILKGQEFLHAKNVLRLNIKDEIIICCGDGIDYTCEIIDIKKDCLVCQVISENKNHQDSIINVDLYQAQVKADKLELIAQKVSEIGVSKLIPFTSEFCVVKGEISKQKNDRLCKISYESAKQCGRSKPLEIGKNINFNEMMNQLIKYNLVLFAYEKAKGLKITQIQGVYDNIAVVVGSEGGFSEAECDMLCQLPNVKCVTLGNRILRAETASIVCCALTMEKFE